MRALTIMAIVLLSGVSLGAQAAFPPKQFQNLQVMPKDSGPAEVIATMKGFTRALGVRCQFCHVGEEGLPLEQFDFPSDSKPQKTVARNMMRMLNEITRMVNAAAPREPGAAMPRVACYSCHRGQTRPAIDRPL